MRLYHPLLDEPLTFEENSVNVLIIENAPALRSFISDLESQIEGMTGEFVLSVNFEPKELTKYAILLTDPFHPELETKKLLNKLQQEAIYETQGLEDRVYRIIADIHELADIISRRMDSNVIFTELNDFSDLAKILNFRPDTESMSLPEILLEYMHLHRKYFSKELFVFYGLKSLLSSEELETFYRSVFYEKFSILLIEAFQKTTPLKEECITIIDDDLCVIQ